MADNLSRRHLLKLAAALPVTAGVGELSLRPRPASAAPATSNLMSMLSTYMSEAASRKLPEEIVEKTKQVILDTVAAMISGAELPPGKFAIQFARAYKGEKIATVAASMWFAVQLKRRWPTGCWPIPTKPTIRILFLSLTRDARWYRQLWPQANNLASTAHVSSVRLRSATTSVLV